MIKSKNRNKEKKIKSKNKKFGHSMRSRKKYNPIYLVKT